MASLPENEMTLGKLQQQFTQPLRSPNDNTTPKNTDPTRFSVYKRLIFNNIEEMFRNAFPVIDSIIKPELRQRILTDFIGHHQAKTALFHEIPQEFLKFLETRQHYLPPYLYELAHYEWLELAVDLSPITLADYQYNETGNLMTGIPVASPLIAHATYQWPVHNIGKDYIPEKPLIDPLHLIVFRNTRNDVGFLEINALTALLIQLIQKNETATGEKLLEQLCELVPSIDAKTMMKAGSEIFNKLFSLDIILGIKEE